MSNLNLGGWQRRHNTVMFLKGIGWLLVAAVTWYLSYWVMWWIVAVLCVQFGSLWNWTPSAELLRNAAWIGIAILAFEGLRFGKELLDREGYAKSAYYDVHQVMGSPRPTFVNPVGQVVGLMYLISEFLLAAPRATMRAFFAFNAQSFLRRDVIPHAEAIVDDLDRRGVWTPPVFYADHKQALYPLHKLGVIWEQVKEEQLLIKLHPNFVDNWLRRGS